MNEDDIDDLYGDDTSDVDYETPAEMPAGEVDALERANWHMRRAAAKTAERAQLKAAYDAEIEKLQIRMGHRLRIIDNEIEWHEAPVRQLHLAITRADPKRKTIELPHGRSSVRTSKTPRVEITDKAALLAWAEKNREEILGHTINVTGVKSISGIVNGENMKPGDEGVVVDSDTAEVIPGVRAVLDEPTWSSNYED